MDTLKPTIPDSSAAPAVSPPSSNPSATSNTVPIRIHKSTARILRSIVTKLNRKSHGKKVRPDQVISKALSLLTDVHLAEIEKASYDSKDQFEIEFKKYCQKNGNISKDEFLKRLMAAALPQIETPSSAQ